MSNFGTVSVPDWIGIVLTPGPVRIVSNSAIFKLLHTFCACLPYLLFDLSVRRLFEGGAYSGAALI